MSASGSAGRDAGGCVVDAGLGGPQVGGWLVRAHVWVAGGGSLLMVKAC